MSISANTAINSQLATLPESDREHLISLLQALANDPFSLGQRATPLPSDNSLFEVRVSSRLRALVRLTESGVEILAVARPDQLMHYTIAQPAA